MSRSLIINDETPHDLLFHPALGRGLVRASGYAGAAGVVPFPQELLIPESEWQARIQEILRTHTGTTDLCLQAGVKPKDQQRTLYCWANSPTWCVEAVRAMNGEPYVPLSPASVGGPITGYQNHGWYGRDAIAYLASNGAVPVAQWPANAINPQYNTAANRQLARRYRIQSWWALSSFAEVVSCLLRRIPVSGGFNWWGHQISLTDAEWVDGALAIQFWNSWGVTWGTDGRGTLQGNRMVPNDAVAPVVVMAA